MLCVSNYYSQQTLSANDQTKEYTLMVPAEKPFCVILNIQTRICEKAYRYLMVKRKRLCANWIIVMWIDSDITYCYYANRKKRLIISIITWQNEFMQHALPPFEVINTYPFNLKAVHLTYLKHLSMQSLSSPHPLNSTCRTAHRMTGPQVRITMA